MSFFEIFNPGMRHLSEERDRQKMLVSKPTPGGGAPLGIDLETGKAKITIAVPGGSADTESADTEQENEAVADPGSEEPGTDADPGLEDQTVDTDHTEARDQRDNT